MKLSATILSVAVHAMLAVASLSKEKQQLVEGCQGDTLPPGKRLTRSQYICTTSGSRFGLDDEGRLGYWDSSGEVIWGWKMGERLEMQKSDGHLVLYDGASNAVWSSGCRGAQYVGAYLQIGKNGDAVQVVTPNNATVLWEIETSNPYLDWTNPSCPHECRGDTLLPGKRLTRNQFICRRGLRLGLDTEGVFGLFDKRGNELLRWTSGDWLEMEQSDGHILLYEYGNVVWENGCANSEYAGSSLVLGSNPAEARVVKPNGGTLWKLYSMNGEWLESDCNPSQDQPNQECVGSTLASGGRLNKNQFLCGAFAHFGLEADGRLALYTYKWVPDGYMPMYFNYMDSPGVFGERLEMQRADGNLVLYNNHGDAVWASGCSGRRYSGAFLTINEIPGRGGGFEGVDVVVPSASGEVLLWRVNLSSGTWEESTCEPDDPAGRD